MTWHRFFPVNFVNYSRTCILCRRSRKGWFWNTTPFTEHFQWLLLTVSGFQPATLLKKRLQQRRFSVNFAICFDKTPPGECLCYLRILRSFSDRLFYRYRWETAYFMYKLQNFNHHIPLKVFYEWFLSILYKNKT